MSWRAHALNSDPGTETSSSSKNSYELSNNLDCQDLICAFCQILAIAPRRRHTVTSTLLTGKLKCGKLGLVQALQAANGSLSSDSGLATSCSCPTLAVSRLLHMGSWIIPSLCLPLPSQDAGCSLFPHSYSTPGPPLALVLGLQP